MRIINASLGYEKEALKGAFGFKGSALTCLWQVIVKLETESYSGIGLGVQSALWSDAAVFSKYGETKSNEMMYALTGYAVRLLHGQTFQTPFELFDFLFLKVYEYTQTLIEIPELRKTFVLNALVPVDFAAWQLWMKENNVKNFDDISSFDGERQTILANIPLITYGMGIEEIQKMALEGTPLFKIKIGSDPNKDGSISSMLAWDKARLEEIHNVLQNIQTPYTENGSILYYLDANGRYDSKDTLLSLLHFAEEKGIADHILMIEEPFDEKNKIDVSDIPYCFAADESAHSIEDVQERYMLGYRALTLKPIAKTLSLTIRMADYARENAMACFCADLTVNPIMVSWNQCVAARLHPLKRMRVGVVESNGKQNYMNWEDMEKNHPMYGHCFTQNVKGVYHLEEEFYRNDGGIRKKAEHYERLL